MKAYTLQSALEHPTETTHLYIRNRNLSEIPSVIFTLKKLKVLGLSKNKISNIPAALETLTHLEELDLSGNNLEVLPENFPVLKQLKVLNLNDNQLKGLPKTIGHLQGLEYFSAANNQLEKLCPELFGAKLRMLDVANNQLEKLPETISKSLVLTKLNLKNNKLSNLPKGIANCKELKQLDLQNNRIKALPDFFQSFLHLGELHLAGNKLTSIPNSIYYCKWLRAIDCSENKIETLPHTITQLQWLSQLNLRKNKIRELPEKIGLLSRLEHLNLEHNQLKELPKSITDLSLLLSLKLVGNKIEFSKYEFLKLAQLRKLSVPKTLCSKTEAAGLITFLKYSRQQKIAEKYRFAFYHLIQENKRCDNDTLFLALNFPLKKVREKALHQLLEYQMQKAPITKTSKIAFAGRTHLPKKQFIEQLEKLGISHQQKPDQTCSHIILGPFANAPLLSSLQEITFLREQDLQAYLIANSTTSRIQFTSESIENLRQLLRSNQLSSIELAIQILNRSVFPKAIINELFIAYKRTEDTSGKRKLRTLLVLNGSIALQQNLGLRLSLSKDLSEDRLRENVDRYARGTELDKEELLELLSVYK